MNNPRLTIKQSSLQKNGSQSLLKLPFIFLFACIICQVMILIYHIYIFGIPDEYMKNNGKFNYFSIITDNFIVQFNYYQLYFAIATIMFIYCKLHQVNKHNIQLIFVITFFFVAISYGLDLCVSFGIYSNPYLFFPKANYLNAEEMPFLFGYVNSFLIIIKPLLLVGLIKVILTTTIINKQARLTYKLKVSNPTNIFTVLFSSMLSIIPMLMLLHIYPYIFKIFDYNFGSAVSYLFTLKLIATTFLIFEFNGIHFVITFFIIKDCFKRDFIGIPIELFLKAAVWSYLFIFISSIMIGTAYFSHQLIVGYFIAYNLVLSMMTGSLYTLFNFIVSMVLIRKVVTKYFGLDEKNS